MECSGSELVRCCWRLERRPTTTQQGQQGQRSHQEVPPSAAQQLAPDKRLGDAVRHRRQHHCRPKKRCDAFETSGSSRTSTRARLPPRSASCTSRGRSHGRYVCVPSNYRCRTAVERAERSTGINTCNLVLMLATLTFDASCNAAHDSRSFTELYMQGLPVEL